MQVAVIGSRNLNIDITAYIPAQTTVILSCGSRGVEAQAERWADDNNIPKLVIRSGYSAPQRRRLIIDMADYVMVIWNGTSNCMKAAISYAQRTGKPVQILTVSG